MQRAAIGIALVIEPLIMHMYTWSHTPSVTCDISYNQLLELLVVLWWEQGGHIRINLLADAGAVSQTLQALQLNIYLTKQWDGHFTNHAA
jgi:hypothetical protein